MQKQSYKFAQRGCPRANLNRLTAIFSLGSKRFASFFTLFLLWVFLVATFKAVALNLDTSLRSVWQKIQAKIQAFCQKSQKKIQQKFKEFLEFSLKSHKVPQIFQNFSNSTNFYKKFVFVMNFSLQSIHKNLRKIHRIYKKNS